MSKAAPNVPGTIRVHVPLKFTIRGGRKTIIGQAPTVAHATPRTRFDDSIVKAFERHPFHHLPVVDGSGKVVGIVSDRDLTRCVTGGRWDGNKLASGIMTQMIASVAPDVPVKQAAQRLVKLGVNSLLILDDAGKLKGILTTRDLVKALANQPE